VRGREAVKAREGVAEWGIMPLWEGVRGREAVKARKIVAEWGIMPLWEGVRGREAAREHTRRGRE
jgi:hypothetical protein